MRRIIYIIFLSILAILLLFFFYRYKTSNQVKPETDIFSAVPADALFMLSIKNSEAFLANFDTKSPIAKRFSEINILSNYIDEYNKTCIKTGLWETLNLLLANGKLVLSIHPIENQNVPLVVFNFSNASFGRKLKNSIVELNLLESSQERDGGEFIILKPESELFKGALFINDTFIIFSPSQNLLNKSLLALSNQNSLSTLATFLEIKRTAGEMASFYIQVSQMKSFSQIVGNGSDKLLNNASLASKWAVLDLKFSDEHLSLNGFSSFGKDSQALSLLSGQEPSESAFETYLPSGVSNLMVLSLSNYDKYLEMLSKNGSKFSVNDSLKNVDELSQIYDTDLNSFIGDLEIKEVSNVSYNNNGTNNNYLVIKSGNGEQASAALVALLRSISAKQNRPVNYYLSNKKIEARTAIPVYYFPISEMFRAIFGSLFDTKNSVVTIYDDLIIFGNDIPSLEWFVRQHYTANLLANDKSFMKVKERFSTKSNLFWYNSFSELPLFFKNTFNELYNNAFLSPDSSKLGFSAVALQIVSHNNLMYNSFLLQSGERQIETELWNWQAKLDTTTSKVSTLVTNHISNEFEFLSQDKQKTLYQINNQGLINWKVQLDGEIISTINQVDKFKNKKLQYLFNTQNSIYLIDRNGKNIAPFPIKLKSRATNGISLFDYDKNLNYRIFVACVDKSIQLFDIDGKIVPDWNFSGTMDIIVNPIQFFRIQKNDYLVFADAKKIYITDRKGRSRITPEKNIIRGFNNICYYTNVDMKTGFTTLDIEGRLSTIYLDGKVKQLLFDTISSNHYLTSWDIDNDEENEWIISDENRIVAFKTNFVRVFDKLVKGANFTKPIIHRISKEKEVISIYDEINCLLYMFETNGDILNGFPFYSTTPALVYPSNNPEFRFNLVVGGENNVINNFKIR